MKNFKKVSQLAIVALALSAPVLGSAQFSTGGDVQRQPAWEQFKLDNTKTMRLNFRNANIDLVLDLYMKVSGITIVKDPALNQPITVSSPKPVKLKEAFEILDAALSLRNFQLEKQNNLLVIRPRRQQQQGGFDPAAMQAMMGQSDVELQVYRIKFASASEVARVINEVFQQQQQAQNPFANFGGFGGFGGGQGGRGRFGGGGGFNPAAMFGGGASGDTVRAAADDFSNSVIVNAKRSKQREVESLIEEIDQQTEQPLQSKVYKLEFASATDLQATVQSVLTANAPQGRGNTGRPQGGFGGFLARLAGPGQGEASVTAEPRSNSLIVNATASAQATVETLIKELDVEVEVATTTFVLPLMNARADTVSQLLNSAFGSRNTGRNNQFGGNQFGGNRTGGNNNRNNNNNNRQGGGGGGGIGRGVEESIRDGELYLDVTGTEGEEELMTQVRTQQGGFFGGGGRQNTQQNQGLVRGADGRLVNASNLDGQVTVIPDPSTNSLIVVTDPQNLELLQQILQQLDRIPEQVMIETIIVEATLDKSMKMGVEWNYTQNPAFGNNGTQGSAGSNFGLANANPALQGLRYSLTGGNLTTFLNALATDDKFAVLSTPRIFTSNNVEAEINISQSVPYVLSSREDANGNLTFNYAFQDVGIVLNVLPRITADGMVTLDVTQTANDLQGFTDFNAPIVNQRQAFTTVSVKDGETIVLGGMMRDTVTSKVKKLPILGDLPLLGELFKSRDRQSVKTELLVFLTPKVVRTPEDAAKLRSDQAKQMSPEGQAKLDQAINAGKPATPPAIKPGPKKDSGK